MPRIWHGRVAILSSTLHGDTAVLLRVTRLPAAAGRPVSPLWRVLIAQDRGRAEPALPRLQKRDGAVPHSPPLHSPRTARVLPVTGGSPPATTRSQPKSEGGPVTFPVAKVRWRKRDLANVSVCLI